MLDSSSGAGGSPGAVIKFSKRLGKLEKTDKGWHHTSNEGRLRAKSGGSFLYLNPK